MRQQVSSAGPAANGLVCSRWREKYQNTPQKVFRLQADGEVPEEGIRGDIGKVFFRLLRLINDDSVSVCSSEIQQLYQRCQSPVAAEEKCPDCKSSWHQTGFRPVLDWYQVRKQPPDRSWFMKRDS